NDPEGAEPIREGLRFRPSPANVEITPEGLDFTGMPRASKRYIDIERTSVRGESFPTFVCKRCNAKPTRTDKINEDVLAVLLRSALGMKLPYLYTFQKFGHHEFGFVVCTCPISGG